MTTLGLTLDWDAKKSLITTTRSGPGSNTLGADKAKLDYHDSLEIERGSGWPANKGIERVDLYDSSSKTGTPAMSWHNGTSTPNSVYHFSDTPASGSSHYTSVTLKDIEQPAVSVSRWYKVTIDGKVLDPEVINTSGGGGGTWTTS